LFEKRNRKWPNTYFVSLISIVTFENWIKFRYNNIKSSGLFNLLILPNDLKLSRSAVAIFYESSLYLCYSYL